MMRRRRMLCYRVALAVTALCGLVTGYSIPHAPQSRQRIRLYSSNDDYSYEEESSSKNRRRIRPKRSTAVTVQAEIRQAEAQERHALALQDPSLLSNVVFAERADLHPSTKRALTETMGLTRMTQVQAKTYAAAYTGKSVVASANTGTGKTLAFLIPSLERLLQGDVSIYYPGRNIGMLVIAPTRELAIQIADQARLLLSFHSKDLTVMDMYGGTKMARDAALLHKRLPTILVATPGRLLDHLQQTRIAGRKFSDILALTRIVVLDETDRLLLDDKGFERDVKRILSFLPRPTKRQTLMFSATLPKRLFGAMQEALDTSNYVQVDCVNHKKQEAISRETDARIKQTFLVLSSMDLYVEKLVDIVLQAMRSTPDNNYKILVFFPATKLVKFFADVCNSMDDFPTSVQQLHSRMTQSSRQRTSNDFRQSKRAILFTSDVSARGVDYPDVTHVIQYGSADSKVTYTHRLGRTGRAGRSGEGLVVLLPFEKKLVNGLRRNGIEENASLDHASDSSFSLQAHEMLQPVRHCIQSGNIKLRSSAEGAYRAFLVYYMSRADALGVTTEQVVNSSNHFAASIGLTKIPSFSAKTAKKLNLLGIEGISIDDDNVQF